MERISYIDNISKRLKEILIKYGIDEILSLNDVSITFNKKKEKRCSVCKIIKDLNLFNKSSRMLDGYKSYCRECSSHMNKEYIKNKIK